jgi:DNA-directed RNA polymerase subunit RPC12/RpoP
MCFRPPTVEAEKTCPECGEKALPSATACAKCGAELQADTLAPGTAPQTQMPSPTGKPGLPNIPNAPSAPSAPAVQRSPGA